MTLLGFDRSSRLGHESSGSTGLAGPGSRHPRPSERVRPIEFAAIGLALILANLRALVIWPLYPDASRPLGPAWLEVTLWLVCVAALYLFGRADGREIARRMKRNWIVIAFVGYCALGILYSDSPSNTAFRAGVLALATLVGAYIGVRFEDSLLSLVKTAALVILSATIFTVLFVPSMGIMHYPPFTGSWRGIFWHKNHLGNITALFNPILLLGILSSASDRKIDFLSIVGFVLSWVVLANAHSASGIISALIMDVFVTIAAVWLLVRARMRPRHYAGAGLVLLGATAAILLNLEAVLGLFHRTPSLTGRTALWKYLLSNVVGQAPWLGHGLGALWSSPPFRFEVRDAVHWGYPVWIADNGFMDVILDVGIVGFTLVCDLLLASGTRSFIWSVNQKTVSSFTQLTLVISVILVNVTYSMFIEIDTSVWIILLISLFSVTRTRTSDDWTKLLASPQSLHNMPGRQ